MAQLNRFINSSLFRAAASSSSLASTTTNAALSSCYFCPSFARGFATLSPLLTRSLQQSDPEIFDIIEKEKRRQRDSLALIPSENFTSLAVLEALGSIMQNKYSEGYPAARYYGGNEIIDMSETLCQKRALEVFGVTPDRWGVNVQPLSGSPCNFYVYTAVLGPHERMMALDLPHGGHLSHGYATPTKKVSAVSIYFECLPYRLNEQTGLIDYDTLEKNALLYRPKLIVSGASAYPRHIDYGRLRKIADSVNALLMIDMAHISGLVAGGSMPSPFDHADIVTTTTHKSLRGPRGAMIFFRRGERKKDAKGNSIQYDLEDKINQAVFPGHQGGPHNHTITALAVALEQAKSKEFKLYSQAILDTNKQLANSLLQRGYKLVSGGTDNHLMLVDLRPKGINGAKVEKICELANIALNKNTVPGDISAMNPGGIRIGTPALTSRGLTVPDFEKVAEFIHRAVEIAIKIQSKGGGSSQKMNDFKESLKNVEKDWPEVDKLKKDVVQFIQKFPAIGFDEKTMKYKD